MRVIIKIGRTEWLLPDDSGVQTLMKTLSKAVQVLSHDSWKTPQKCVITNNQARLELVYLPDNTRFQLFNESTNEATDINLTTPAPKARRALAPARRALTA